MSERVVRPPQWGRVVDGGGVASGGEPPYDGGMDDRIKKLEEFVGEARSELRQIDVRLAKIESSLDQSATKSDVTDAINGQIKWIVGTAVVLGSLGLTIMTFVLNNAVPKQAPGPAAQQAPIVIYAQPGPTVTTPAAKPPS